MTSPIQLRPIENRFLRVLQLFGGLAAYGLAVALMVRSGLGLGPWEVLHMGISLVSPLTIGTASILVGVLIVGSTYFAGLRPGPGTLANMVFLGLFADLFLWLLPAAQDPYLAYLWFITGAILVGLATGMYIGSRFGRGPRDGLMILASEATGFSIRVTRTGIEALATLSGWLLGGTVGIGTVIFLILIGPATQFGLSLFGQLPAPVRKPVAAAECCEG